MVSHIRSKQVSPQLLQPSVFPLLRYREILSSLVLAVGLLTSGLPVPSAQSQSSLPTSPPLSDGVYLYGQSPRPDVLGSAYIVLEVKGSKVIGAFYMPHSSFDCVYGAITPKELRVTIVDSYERTHYPYAIAVQQQQTIASTGTRLQPTITLKGFHPIATVSENDQRILGICKQEYGF